MGLTSSSSTGWPISTTASGSWVTSPGSIPSIRRRDDPQEEPKDGPALGGFQTRADVLRGRLRNFSDEFPKCVEQSVPISESLPVDRDRDPGSQARDVRRDLRGTAQGSDRLDVACRNAEGGELGAIARPCVPLGRAPVRAGDRDEPRRRVLRHVRHEMGIGSSGGAVAWLVIDNLLLGRGPHATSSRRRSSGLRGTFLDAWASRGFLTPTHPRAISRRVGRGDSPPWRYARPVRVRVRASSWGLSSFGGRPPTPSLGSGLL